MKTDDPINGVRSVRAFPKITFEKLWMGKFWRSTARPVACLAAAAFGLLFLANNAQALTYSFVGSWQVGDGPNWTSNPPVYSGQEAAALLFGGAASDYAISTAGSNPADINFSAWLDGWSDAYTYADSGNPAPQNYSLDLSGLGYNGCQTAGITCDQSAYSAYVGDHFVNDSTYTNYAFSISGNQAVSPVPLPESFPLFLSALSVLGLIGWRRARVKQSLAVG